MSFVTEEKLSRFDRRSRVVPRGRSLGLIVVAVAAVFWHFGCGGDAPDERPPGHGAGPASKAGRGGGPGGGGMPRGRSMGESAAVPVEVAAVTRRTISSYIETNGTLEAENEVDVVARTAGPIVLLGTEEGESVRKGQVLARLDDVEYRAQVEIARVTLNETKLAFERAKNLQVEQLISPESYERALSSFETAQAQFEAARIQLGFTTITAPFDGLIINRYINFAEQVSTNTPLFRISDFDPLLSPIQLPERELPRLRLGQPGYLTVEPFPDEKFSASILRISPVIDAATGTVKVTLQVRSAGKLRPGMFARVFVEVETRNDALVIPKAALSLESIGDTVYVADGEVASRREVGLGFAEGDFVEVVSGLADNESVVVVGQDGLSDGTPIQVLQAEAASPSPPVAGAMRQERPPGGSGKGPAAKGGPPGRRMDPSQMTPEQLEQLKQRMRDRGLTDEQIEERLQRARERSGSGQQ
jgi:RND family efflux transporter MFP subunit